MKNKFLFTVGALVAWVSAVPASDRAELDYGWEYRPYITLRGGRAFAGDMKGDSVVSRNPAYNRNMKGNIKSAWSGSGEFGVSCFNDRVLVGLELGYFITKKTAFSLLYVDGVKMIFPSPLRERFRCL